MELSEYGVMYRLEQSYWWFVGKQFLVREQVKPLLLNRGAGARILDIGSGTGIILKTLEEFGQAFGMEMSREAIQFLKNPRSRTVDQMVQAARSGRQNIAAGSRAAATSSQTEPSPWFSAPPRAATTPVDNSGAAPPTLTATESRNYQRNCLMR